MMARNPSIDAGVTLPPGVPVLGTVLAGKYRLDGILGIGGMGVVYRSRHALLGVPVAVKIILPEFASRPEFVARFTNEARAAARIQSDHIARVNDVGTTADGMSFLVMELLDGEDLASLLSREGPQPLDRCLDWVLQACAGLADAHAEGIVHRDLKPSNLFLARRQGKADRLKIFDFGISKGTFEEAGGQITSTNTMLGSPAYMAPEQLRSSRTVDKRADIWSLGVILYELLTGSTPFNGENLGAVFAAILEMDPIPLRSLLPSIPEQVDRAVLQCLRRSLDARYADVSEVALALAPFAPEEGKAILNRASLRPGGPASSPPGLGQTKPHMAARPAPWQATPAEGRDGAPSSERFRGATRQLEGALAQQSASSSSGGESAAGTATPSPRPRRRFIAAIAIGLALALAVAILVVGQASRARARAPIPVEDPSGTETTMTITASPPEARIFVDDVLHATNPVTVTVARDRNPHRLRVEAPGYVPRVQSVSASMPSLTVDVSLEHAPTLAPLPSTPPSVTPTEVMPPRPPSFTARTTPAARPAATPTGSPSSPAPASVPVPASSAATRASAPSGIYTDPWKH
jgi:eukaryotic-like serine/threonine-protein kinase